MLQALERLSGPRRVLLGSAALLFAVSFLPWFHYSSRGVTLEVDGWSGVGVLAWILALEVVVWELVRAARISPVGGDRGDRYSAVGGLATAFVGLLFVLRRAFDGDLGYGWVPGTMLVAALAWASWILFLSSSGPAAIDARLGRGEAPPESRPDDGRPAPVRPAPAANWRRIDQGAVRGGTATATTGGPAPAWSSGRARPADPAPAARLGLGTARSASSSAAGPRAARDDAAREDGPARRGGPREGAAPGRETSSRDDALPRRNTAPPEAAPPRGETAPRRQAAPPREDAQPRREPASPRQATPRREDVPPRRDPTPPSEPAPPRRDAPARRDDAPAWSSIDAPAPVRRTASGGRTGTPAWNRPADAPRDRADLPPWRGGPRSADPGGDRTRAWESAVEREEDLPPWRRPQEPPPAEPTPTRHRPRLPWRDRRATGDGDELPPWRGGTQRPDPPGGRPAWRDPGAAGRNVEDARPSRSEKRRDEPPLW
ncbi:hypothetical protein [Patulibacter minatonensis]|uniref:hypothetical protein n=1 Tax=Patulibacter minatonensis TaxID=298163 RepID=UPI00047E1A16|nr:hypothetical protein [Patulibacter minatonensis]